MLCLVTGIARHHGNISLLTLEGAIACVESNFLNFVRNERRRDPALVCMGTCCLASVIYKGTLLIAHLGDSRAVIGYTNNANKIIAEPLTADHNVNIEEIRQEFGFSHREDPHIVVHRNGAFRVKGLLQVFFFPFTFGESYYRFIVVYVVYISKVASISM